MFTDRTKCNICGRKINHYTPCHDPLFYVYKCDDCGYYVSLREIQKYMENINSPIISKDMLEKYKANNKYDYGYTVFLIGNKTEIEYAQKSHFEKYLQTGPFHFNNVIYLDNQGE